MNTKIVLLAILCAALTLVSAHNHNHNYNYSTYNHNINNSITYDRYNSYSNNYTTPKKSNNYWNSSSFDNYWSSKQSLNKTINYYPIPLPTPSVSKPYYYNNYNSYNNTRRSSPKSKHSHSNLFRSGTSKSQLWEVFTYMNRGYRAIDDECRYNSNKNMTGCCMRGRFYSEETCWISLLSFAVIGTAFIVLSLVMSLVTLLVCCCCCLKIRTGF